MNFLALLALVAATLFGAVGCGAEPSLNVAPGVELSRFQGKWYEIARLPRTTQTDCHGTTAFYTQSPDGSFSFVNQCNVGSMEGPLTTQAMTATVPDSRVPAKLALNVGGYSGDYWILDVGPNYEYAVVGHPSRLYLWILSRSATMDQSTLDGILSRAESQQFDTSKLEYTPQPPPGERDTLATPLGAVPPAVHTGCAASPEGGYGGSTAWGAALALLALGLCARRRHTGGRGETPGYLTPSIAPCAR